MSGVVNPFPHDEAIFARVQVVLENASLSLQDKMSQTGVIFKQAGLGQAEIKEMHKLLFKYDPTKVNSMIEDAFEQDFVHFGLVFWAGWSCSVAVLIFILLFFVCINKQSCYQLHWLVMDLEKKVFFFLLLFLFYQHLNRLLKV